MSEEFLNKLLEYINTRIKDEFVSHEVSKHSGCYYAFSNEASGVAKELKEMLKGNL